MALTLLALALAPVFAIVWYVYAKDKHDKEPKRLLFLAFSIGVLSIIPALIGHQVFSPYGEISDNILSTAFYAFIVVAFSEEFGKYLFLRYVMFKKAHFNEPYDGIIYAVMIGMGFAAFENLMYVAEGGLSVAILRMFTAVPAHAIFGVTMGYWVGMAKFEPFKKNLYLATGLLVAVLLHGAYDFFLMQTNYPAMSLVTFIGLIPAIRWSKKAIKVHAENSPFNIKVDETI
jgi:RsiW-degrading membrane proteinase PrsW (M82 family)